MMRRAAAEHHLLRRPPPIRSPRCFGSSGRGQVATTECTRGFSASSNSYLAARAQRLADKAKEEAEEQARNARAFRKTKAAVALFGAMCFVPGPYARWSLDADKSQPTATAGGALRRVAEDAGAEGEGAPFHAYPFGHAVPVLARKRCDMAGFDFSNNSGIRWGMFCCDAYWNEFASYAITPAAKTELEVATFTLHSMVLEMIDEVVKDSTNTYMRLFEIPEELQDAVRSSWRNRQQDLYGRFDLLWDGNGPPKMLEYNGDTATVILESGPAQRAWLESKRQRLGKQSQLLHHLDQFNSIEKELSAAWPRVFGDLRSNLFILHQNDGKEHGGGGEETATARFLANTARASPGLLADVHAAPIDDFNMYSNGNVRADWLQYTSEDGKPFWYNSATQESTWDRPGTPAFHKKYTMKYNTAKGSLGTCRSKKTGSRLEVGAVWKLYPWEWLAQEDVGRIVEENPGVERRIHEPAWKLLVGNKAMLAMLWEFYPNHPNLLPAYWDESSLVEALVTSPELAKQNWVSKPRFGREGTGITYWKQPEKHATSAVGTPHLDPYSEKTKLQKWATEQERAIANTEVNSYSSAERSPVFPLGLPVFQQWATPPKLQGRHVITGSWIVNGTPAGVCFREDVSVTTNDDSCVVPHYIDGYCTEANNGAAIAERLSTPRHREVRSHLYGNRSWGNDHKPAENVEEGYSGSSDGGGSNGSSSTSGGGGRCGYYGYRGGSYSGSRGGSGWRSGGNSYSNPPPRRHSSRASRHERAANIRSNNNTKMRRPRAGSMGGRYGSISGGGG